jgi:hypothetical protein
MTESTDTAPLRGQSLRGRPVHETCTPVNEGNQPLRDEGEAVAWPPSYPLILQESRSHLIEGREALRIGTTPARLEKRRRAAPPNLGQSFGITVTYLTSKAHSPPCKG